MNGPFTALNINELCHRKLISLKTGEELSKSAVLTDYLQFQHLFVHHERLEPGKRASAPHRHTIQEEMVVVLKGNPTVHIGDQVIQLNPSDFIGFNPDAAELHFIENMTQEEVEFLVICSSLKTDLVIYE